MKKKLIIAAVAIVVIIIPVYFIFISGENKSDLVNENKQLYTCGMHPQIISDEPGLCPICEMKLTPIKNQNKSSGERKILFYRNPMNPNITSPTPMKDQMGMDYVPIYEDEAGSEGIVSIDPTVQQNMNIKTAVVEKKSISSILTTNGILQTDETREYIVTTKVDGWIEKLYVNYTGQFVQAGSKLMVIYSPMLVSAQQEFITALSYQSSTASSSLKEIQKSSNELVINSIRKLQLLNVSDTEIERLKNTKEVKTTITLYAQNSGTVLEKNILDGQKIMAGEPLLKISNLSNLWIIAEIYEQEVQKVKIWSAAQIKFNYLPGKNYQGRVSFIYPVIDEKSRTVKVRIDVPNSNGELKPSMFANVEIVGPQFTVTPVITENAVIRSGKMDIVIVSLGDGKFKPQMVDLGIYSDGFYQVLDGLSEGDNIVSSAQFLIDSESNLKAAISKFQSGKNGQKGGEIKPSEKMIMDKKSEMNEKKMESKQTESKIKGNHEHDNHSSIVRVGLIDVESIDKNNDGKLFECPMDWNVISDEDGRCPECNMYLEEFSIDEIKSNLNKHGFDYKK